MADQCNAADTYTHERNFFAAYAAPEMEKINDVMQDKFEPLWVDHGGHSQATIKEATDGIRTYNFCLESLCGLIARDCGAHNQVGDWEKNYQRCTQRHQKMLELSRAQLDITLEGNTARKSRSLMVETTSRLSRHFDEFLHPTLSNFNRYIDTAQQAILALTRQTW